ncbi:MAG: hypothetical protein RL701_6579, partial [Pseudomonadota bacterium]
MRRTWREPLATKLRARLLVRQPRAHGLEPKQAPTPSALARPAFLSIMRCMCTSDRLHELAREAVRVLLPLAA